MNIFLSWSEDKSRAVALALKDTLPFMMQEITIFYSGDIEKGKRGTGEIADALEGTNFGIICLTPDNLKSPWIHWEAGALTKFKDNHRAWTLLLEVEHSDIEPPLAGYQHTISTDKDDFYRLIQSINGGLDAPLTDERLKQMFELAWPAFEAAVKKAIDLKPSPRPARNPEEMLEEVLEIVRRLDRSSTIPNTRAQLNRDLEENSDELRRQQYYKELLKFVKGDSFGKRLEGRNLPASIVTPIKQITFRADPMPPNVTIEEIAQEYRERLAGEATIIDTDEDQFTLDFVNPRGWLPLKRHARESPFKLRLLRINGKKWPDEVE